MIRELNDVELDAVFGGNKPKHKSSGTTISVSVKQSNSVGSVSKAFLLDGIEQTNVAFVAIGGH